MGFLQPGMLWVLPAILLPIVIHLLNRLRYRTVHWAAMIFLLKANRAATRRAKLKQWLLLACRVLVLGFLIWAMSRPLVGGWLGAAAGGAPEAVVILLDRSASMEGRAGDGERSKRTQALALLAEAAKLSGGSRFVLIENVGREPLEVAGGAALAALQLAEPTDTGADLPAMFRAASEWLVRNKPGSAEVWVASDLQASNWRPESPEWADLAARFAGFTQGVRVRVIDDRGRELCASRELSEISAALHTQKREASVAVARIEPESWRRARAKWEKPPQTTWSFGDLPNRVLVTENAGVPVFAFPALQPEKTGVALRLSKDPEEAEAITRQGLAALLELQLGRDLGWLERDLKSLRNLGPLTATLAPMETLQQQAFGLLRHWLCDPARITSVAPIPGPANAAGITPLTGTAFANAAAKAKADLQGLVPRFVAQLREILSLRQTLLVQAHPYPGMEHDLATLIPPDFLQSTPYAQLANFPRYLKAMKAHAERWRQNPAKDAERAALLAPYLAALSGPRRKMESSASNDATSETARRRLEPLRWLLEEFRVSLFAQELGTAQPVSQVKLDRVLAELKQLTSGPASTTSAAAVDPTTPKRTAEAAPFRPLPNAPEKKGAPLKTLGALDRLFPRT